MTTVSQGWRWGLVLSGPTHKYANLIWITYHILMSGSSAILSKQEWRKAMANLRWVQAVKPLNILTDYWTSPSLCLSEGENMLICFFASCYEAASSEEGENKKANKHVRVMLCKENITTFRPMQGCLNHISWNIRHGFPETASQSTSKEVSQWQAFQSRKCKMLAWEINDKSYNTDTEKI